MISLDYFKNEVVLPPFSNLKLLRRRGDEGVLIIRRSLPVLSGDVLIAGEDNSPQVEEDGAGDDEGDGGHDAGHQAEVEEASTKKSTKTYEEQQIKKGVQYEG